MVEHDQKPALTVAGLSKDLRELRRYGLYPAIEKGKLPLLTRLARAVATKDDPSAFEQMTSGSTHDRRRGLAAGVRALIDTVSIDLEADHPGVVKLFGLDIEFGQATPNNPERLIQAADAANRGATYLPKLTKEWIERLAKLMYERYSAYIPAMSQDTTTLDASDVSSGDAVSEAAIEPPSTAGNQEAVPSASDSTSNSDPAHDYGPKPPETRPDQPPSPEVPRPVTTARINVEPPQRHPSGIPRFAWRRLRFLGIVLTVLAVGVVIVLITLHQGRGSASALCGPTTAQLFKRDNSTIFIYAPHQESAEHGWDDQLLMPPGSPEKREVFAYREIRLFALGFTNESSATQWGLIAQVYLPATAKLQPNTTCLYRDNNYATGKRYKGTDLLESGGLKIGSLAPKQSIYVTFEAQLPSEGLTENMTTTRGAIGPEATLRAVEWAAKGSQLPIELTR